MYKCVTVHPCFAFKPLDSVITRFILFQLAVGNHVERRPNNNATPTVSCKNYASTENMFHPHGVFLHPDPMVFAAPRWSIWGNEEEVGSKYRLN